MKTTYVAGIMALLVSACTATNQHIKSQQNELNEAKTNAQQNKQSLEKSICNQVVFKGEQESFRTIDSSIKAYNIPQLSLTIINSGAIEWSEVYSNSKFTQVEETNPPKIYQTASLSKPVTFMAALRMHAEGAINLDENVQTYLTSFQIPQGAQTAENPVTFRSIFAHTSGINPHGYMGYSRSVEMPTDVAVLKGDSGVNSPAIQVISPPNQQLAYSGGAYTLAELALQDIFKQEFAEIMHQWILEPIGMTNSEFTQPLPQSMYAKVAKGYNQAGELVEGGWHNHPEQAAAGLWSTSDDMALFLIEIYMAYQGKSKVFTKADILEILKHERDQHVYGFIVNHNQNDTTLTHYGGNVGYRTGMTISLTTGKGLVYLINSDNGASLGNELLLSASKFYGWTHFQQTEVQRKSIQEEQLAALAGKYNWNNQVDLALEFTKSELVLYFPNGDAYPLVPIEGKELEFIHPNTGLTIWFTIKNNQHQFSLYGQEAVKIS